MDDFELYTLVKDIQSDALNLQERDLLPTQLGRLYEIPLCLIAFSDRVALNLVLRRDIISTPEVKSRTTEWLLPWNRVGGYKRG